MENVSDTLNNTFLLGYMKLNYNYKLLEVKIYTIFSNKFQMGISTYYLPLKYKTRSCKIYEHH